MKDGPSDSDSPNWLGLPLIATLVRVLSRELTLQNEHLRTENRILRSHLPGRIRFTDDERRTLVETAMAMGRNLMRETVTIVKPETILGWQRRLEKQKWDYSERRKRKPGRPRTLGNIEELVCRMARENIWGYKRIVGELAKLEITVSKSCVANILLRNSLPPSPERNGLTWREFLSRHADVLLCTDFLTQEIWTCKGLQRAYVMFVIHLRTRRVLLARATFSPHTEWVKQQIRNVMWECEDRDIEPRFFLHDNDSCFGSGVDNFLSSCGVEPKKTPYKAPNANSHAERWVRTIRQECLNHLILFGLGRLQRVVNEYVAFYNTRRPHQGIGNVVPKDVDTKESVDRTIGNTDSVKSEEFLGGLLKSYYREAA